MFKQYTDAEKIKLLKQAQQEYNKATTKTEVEEVLRKYGQEGIGWRPVCRCLIGKQGIESALKLNGNKH